MRISSVSNNYYQRPSFNRIPKNSPNFKGQLDDSAIDIVLEKLKPNVSDVKITDNINDLKKTMDELYKIHKTRGIASLGLMIIPDKDLKDFTENRIPDIFLKDRTGICVAVGDKYGPVETFDKVYEARLLLLPKNVNFS